MHFKFSFKNLKCPTPSKMVRLGNALFTISATTAIPQALKGNLVITYVLIGVGVLGKFLTEFFTTALVSRMLLLTRATIINCKQ